MSKVFFASARAKKWDYKDSLSGKLERLIKKINFKKYFKRDEEVAVKTHFGSEGAHRIIRPIFIRKVVDGIRVVKAKPFVTDTVRIMGLDYLEIANQNGINHHSCGAPVVLADGLNGKDNILVKVKRGRVLKEVAIATLIHDVSAMVVLSHCKGHINAGYAGAIKNLAMGGISSEHRIHGWKKGRGCIHTFGEGIITWTKEKCTYCNQCVNVCPLGIIEFKGKKWSYIMDECWRCGRCTRVCPEKALHLPQNDEYFQKGLAEGAGAVLSTFKKKKVIYINFLLDIQPECDCMPVADVPLFQDQGILISDDMVAIEQASVDILRKARFIPDSMAGDRKVKEGEDVLRKLHGKEYQLQIDEAERLGLGSKRYTLISV